MPLSEQEDWYSLRSVVTLLRPKRWIGLTAEREEYVAVSGIERPGGLDAWG